MTTQEFINYCFHRHDVECNQKYANNLPYSFHLKMVINQYNKFKDLLPNNNMREFVKSACAGHDLIEDARLTYNDILQMAGKDVADMVFYCTEMRGRDRKERHSDEFYTCLFNQPYAMFVKLCDIIANVKMSLFENSSMFDKYKSEYPHMKEMTFKSFGNQDWKPMYDYLEKLFEIQ
jgi:(p)ppGpp synthase/HD superfamily hydrolase